MLVNQLLLFFSWTPNTHLRCDDFLVYPDHVQNWLDFGHNLFFFFFKFGGGCGVGAVLTLWNGSNLWSPSISGRTHGRNGRKFGMLMYPADHLQIWLDYGHGMLIFLILAQFWLKETGKGRGVKMCEECFLGILMSWIWCRFCRPWTHDCCGWGPNLPTEIYSLA